MTAQHQQERGSSEILADVAIKAAIETLVKHGITIDGKSYAIEPFSDHGLDVKHIGHFDHIELKIIKTGWGMSIGK